MEFPARTEQAIADWHAILPPNEAAHRFAADLAVTIAAFEALRGGLEFEQEPSDFEVALRETAA
jgi:hypothetical protein